jgi:YbbR domain-containing protein
MSGIWPFRHFGLKIWSVLLAMMLWFVVSGQETVERGLRVPLELQQFPAGLELQGEPPSLVDVRVRGASGGLSRLGPGDIVAVLDLRAVRPGRRLFQLSPEQVRAPFGVQIVQVLPPSITLVFEPSASKQVPIAASIEGDPAPGFVVGGSDVIPPTVEIEGPASAVERVAEAITEPVSVAGAQHDVIDTVTVGLLDQSLRVKMTKPASVTVHVMPGPKERTVAGLPVRVRNLDAGLRAQLTPNAVEAVFRGTSDSIGRIDSNAVVAYVDLSGLAPGDYALGVHVDASQGAGVARVIPATVQVRIGQANK